MNNSLASIIQACAAKVHEEGFQYFGVQDYKECWSGANGSMTYNRYGRSDKCRLEYGVGTEWSNFVYRLVEGQLLSDTTKEVKVAEHSFTTKSSL